MPNYEIDELIDAAREAAENAYVPYSNFPVGAAVFTTKGNTYSGCNVENSNVPISICAERAAVANAVLAGDMDIVAIAIFAPSAESLPYPCGTCRQFLEDFGKDMDVVVAGHGEIDIRKLSELLPFSFSMDKREY